MPSNQEIWEFIFKEQIEDEKTLVDENTVVELRGRTAFFRPYSAGQKVMRFLQITQEDEDPTTIKFKLDSFMYPMELNQMMDSFMFMDCTKTLPTVISKSEFFKKMFESVKNAHQLKPFLNGEIKDESSSN